MVVVSLFYVLIQCSIVSLHLNYTRGFPVIKEAEHVVVPQ